MLRLSLAVLLALLCAAARSDTELVRDGRPVAVIVDGGTPEGCRPAAAELRGYLKRMSGAELEIVSAPRANVPNVFVGGNAALERLGRTAEQLGLGRDGFVIAIIRRNAQTGQVIGAPEIISRGFVFLRDAEDLLAQAGEQVVKTLSSRKRGTRTEASGDVRAALEEFLYNETKRRPMVIPVLIED